MALTLQEIDFTYPKAARPVLNGFSASFAPARITAVSGPNGCGKTTLSKIMVGILKPASGRVLLDGQSIAPLSLAQIGRRIGYVMQNPNQQLFCVSAAQEVRYGLKNMGLDEDAIEAKVSYYLDYFELGRYRNSIPFHLSLGEKQRLILAAIMAMEPKYLLLDEPTASLDVYRKRLLGQSLQKTVLELGCGVILISHDRAFIERYAAAEIQLGKEPLQ